MLTLHRIAEIPALLWVVILLVVMAVGAFVMAWVERRRSLREWKARKANTVAEIMMNNEFIAKVWPAGILHSTHSDPVGDFARMFKVFHADAHGQTRRRPARRMPRVRYRATRSARTMAAEISA